jgi:starch phosphorylase
VLLLDTDVDQNMLEDREITDEHHGRDQTYRLKREIILGIGGAAMLKALEFGTRTYRMNEGNAAFPAAYLLRQFATKLMRIQVHPASWSSHHPANALHTIFMFQFHDGHFGNSHRFPV